MTAHPIAFVSSRLPDGRLFVPTRHEHGSESTNRNLAGNAKFDHVIYAVNAKEGQMHFSQAPHPSNTILGDKVFGDMAKIQWMAECCGFPKP